MEKKSRDGLERLKDVSMNVVHETESSLNKLKGFHDDYVALRDRLIKLPDKLLYKINVPFGKVGFMPGKLVNTNCIDLLLGDNWFVKTSAKNASQIIDRRINYLSKKISEMTKQKDLIEPRIKIADKLFQESKEFVEITEQVTEEEEKEWKEKHRENVKKSKLKEKEMYTNKTSFVKPTPLTQPTDNFPNNLVLNTSLEILSDPSSPLQMQSSNNLLHSSSFSNSFPTFLQSNELTNSTPSLSFSTPPPILFSFNSSSHLNEIPKNNIEVEACLNSSVSMSSVITSLLPDQLPDVLRESCEDLVFPSLSNSQLEKDSTQKSFFSSNSKTVFSNSSSSFFPPDSFLEITCGKTFTNYEETEGLPHLSEGSSLGTSVFSQHSFPEDLQSGVNLNNETKKQIKTKEEVDSNKNKNLVIGRELDISKLRENEKYIANEKKKKVKWYDEESEEEEEDDDEEEKENDEEETRENEEKREVEEEKIEYERNCVHGSECLNKINYKLYKFNKSLNNEDLYIKKEKSFSKEESEEEDEEEEEDYQTSEKKLDQTVVQFKHSDNEFRGSNDSCLVSPADIYHSYKQKFGNQVKSILKNKQAIEMFPNLFKEEKSNQKFFKPSNFISDQVFEKTDFATNSNSSCYSSSSSNDGKKKKVSLFKKSRQN